LPGSLAGVAAFTGAAYAAEHYRHTLGGKIGLGLLLVLVLAAALRALKVGGHFADLLAIAGAAAMLYYGYDVTLGCRAAAAGGDGVAGGRGGEDPARRAAPAALTWVSR
jgi:hypothetical protein